MHACMHMKSCVYCCWFSFLYICDVYSWPHKKWGTITCPAQGHGWFSCLLFETRYFFQTGTRKLRNYTSRCKLCALLKFIWTVCATLGLESNLYVLHSWFCVVHTAVVYQEIYAKVKKGDTCKQPDYPTQVLCIYMWILSFFAFVKHLELQVLVECILHSYHGVRFQG